MSDLVLGSCCAACERPGRLLCARCQRVLGSGSLRLAAPDPRPEGFPVTVAAGPYDDVTRQLVSAYKDRGVWALRTALAERGWLALEALLTSHRADQPVDLRSIRRVSLVPVPSRPDVVRARGLDTTAALAASVAQLARRHRWPMVSHRGLRTVRRVADQAGLTVGERAANLAGALQATSAVAGRDVVLIDDVVTTGASLHEAARAVRAGGGVVIGAATVAATVRRRAARPADRRLPGRDSA